MNNPKKKVIWVIQDYKTRTNYGKLKEFLKNNDYNFLEFNPEANYSAVKESCVCSVTIEAAKILGKNFENYKCTKYYNYLGKYLLNSDYAILFLSELIRRKFYYFGIFGRDAKIFIRPDSGEKPFTGQTLDLLDLDSFADYNKEFLHELVIVSTPKSINWEGRFVCLRNEIIGYSTYKFQDNITKIPSVPPESINYVNLLLKSVDYAPDKVFCYDIGERNGEFYVLELTSFFSCDIYEANVKNVVEGISKVFYAPNQKL